MLSTVLPVLAVALVLVLCCWSIGSALLAPSSPLVALLCDLSLRARGAATLDDVMRALWHVSGGGVIDEARIADALAEAGVSILTSSPAAVPVPPVKALRARGVTIHAGSDNIRSCWATVIEVTISRLGTFS